MATQYNKNSIFKIRRFYSRTKMKFQIPISARIGYFIFKPHSDRVKWQIMERLKISQIDPGVTGWRGLNNNFPLPAFKTV